MIDSKDTRVGAGAALDGAIATIPVLGGEITPFVGLTGTGAADAVLAGTAVRYPGIDGRIVVSNDE